MACSQYIIRPCTQHGHSHRKWEWLREVKAFQNKAVVDLTSRRADPLRELG